MIEGLDQRIRRNSWYGLKPAVARLLTMRAVNAPARRLASLILPKPILHRMPVSASRAVYRLASGAKVELGDPQADQLAKDLVWGKGAPTSPAEARVLRFVEQRALEVDLFLDIGAYSCLFSLVALKANPRLRAIAFEVLPENFLLCWQNVVRNDAVARADVRLCGIGREPGKIAMPLHTGSASNPSSVSLAADFPRGTSIPIVKLDSLGLDGPMLWKIDVEGFEWDVLQGARITVEKYRPGIVCEILPAFAHASDVQAFLEPLGYKFFIALPSGFEQRSDIVPDRAGRDWIFTTSPVA